MVEKHQKLKGKKGKKTGKTVSRGLADKRKVKSVDAIFPVEEFYTLFEKSTKNPRFKNVVFDLTCLNYFANNDFVDQKGKVYFSAQTSQKEQFCLNFFTLM
jgi:hypothetical protein